MILQANVRADTHAAKTLPTPIRALPRVRSTRFLAVLPSRNSEKKLIDYRR